MIKNGTGMMPLISGGHQVRAYRMNELKKVSFIEVGSDKCTSRTGRIDDCFSINYFPGKYY